MLCSKPMQQNLGHIITECRLLCLVPSLEECMHSILPAHPPSWQHKYSISSIQRKTEQRIKLILHFIHLWLLFHLILALFYLTLALFYLILALFYLILVSFHPISAPLQLPPPYHLSPHQILVYSLLLAAQGLHHLHLFLQQSIPNLLSNVMFLWAWAACHILLVSPPVVMLAGAQYILLVSPLVVMLVASFENTSMIQDWRVVCSPLVQVSFKE